MNTRAFSLPLGLALAAIGSAQEYGSLASFLASWKQPAKMMPKDMPPSFRAMKIESGAAGGGLMDMLTGPMAMFGAMMGGAKGEGDSEMAVFSVMGLSWTNGKMITIGGDKFLVTYRMTLDMTSMMASKEPNFASMPLSMNLVKWSSVSAFSPSSVTKAEFLKILSTKPKKKPTKSDDKADVGGAQG
ncbi:MAG: hypothetical protein JSS72_09475 [Armatimonadetes bacterium]|nr:hypothetical protein [Armatimonadota bacterium]